MNLLIKRSALFFSTLIALASCDDPTNIGENLQEPGTQIGTYYTENITVDASTILLNDSLNSFKSNTLLAGYMTDPTFGLTTASTFTELALSTASVKFGKDDVLLDAVLYLDYSFYGDGSKPLKLNVYELDENFREDKSYYTTTDIPAKSTVIGTVTVQPDYILQNNKPLAIPLTNDFARKIFEKHGETELSSQAEFLKFIKGIVIKPEVPAGQTSGGSVLSFDIFDAKTRLALNYTDKSDAANPKYTTYNFLIRESSARFNQIIGDRTNSNYLKSLDTAGDTIGAEKTGDLTYLQAGTGISTKLTFPDLDKLRQEHGNIVINKAELIVPVQRETNPPLAPPPVLFLFESGNNRILTINGTKKAVQVDGGAFLNSLNNPASLRLNSEDTYNLIMTSYVQAMLSNTKPRELVLSTASNFVSVVRGIVKADQTGSPENRIRLKIYFSKIN